MTGTSKICQGTGFLLLYAIETCDLVILLIAVHTALCVFKPRANLGESGLYQYRITIYFGLPMIPVLPAGLGLMEGGKFVNAGTICWLPVRPFWYISLRLSMAALFRGDKLTLRRYRLSLSWVPRYLILFTILALYTAIFLRVRHSFRMFLIGQGSQKRPEDTESSGVFSISRSRARDSALTPPARPKLMIDPPIPHLERHGLIESPIFGGGSSQASCHTSSTPQWEYYTFGSVTPIPPPPARSPNTEPPPAPDPASAHHHDGSVSTRTPSSLGSSQLQTLSEALRSPPPRSPPATDGTDDDQLHRATDGPNHDRTLRLQLSDHLPTQTHAQRPSSMAIDQPMRARHRAIARHLRFLFLYPLVYFLLWLPGFVAHCWSYADAYAARPSAALTCVSVAAVSAQCAVDAALFAWRERPHRTTTRRAPAGGPALTTSRRAATTAEKFRVGLRQGSAHWRLPRHPWGRAWAALRRGTLCGDVRAASGRQKAEQVASARAARSRRAGEIQDSIELAEKRRRHRKRSGFRRGGREKAWWDAAGSVADETEARSVREGEGGGEAEAVGGGDASTEIGKVGEGKREEGDAADGLPTVRENVE